MHKRQSSSLQSLRASHAFIDENADKLGTIPTSAARTKLSAAIADLSAHATDQLGRSLSAQGGTKRASALRRDLIKNHIAPIARIGAVELPHTQELEPLRAPVKTINNQALAKLAQGIGQAAAPFASVFIAAGLPDDFLAQLDAATASLLAAIDVRQLDRSGRVGATKGLSEGIRVARKRLRVVDSLVQPALQGEAALLSNWVNVQRIARPRTKHQPTDVVPTPVTAPPAAATVPATDAPAHASETPLPIPAQVVASTTT